MRVIKPKLFFVRIKGLMPYFIILLLSLAFTFPIFNSIHNTGIRDWDLFCYVDEVPRKTILEYNQFPLWSPYSWGGHSIIGDLQAGYLRPTFLFTLLFGCVVGLKIEIFFMIALGMTGMYLLSRYYKMSAVAGLLSASIFGLSSFFSLQMTEGHTWVFPFALLPFIFLFFLLSLQQRWYIIPAAIFLVLVVFAGGNVHVAPLVSVFLAAYSVILSIKNRDIKPLINLFFIYVLLFGLGAIKILPALESAIEYPRLIEERDFIKPGGVYQVFLGSKQSLNVRAFDGQGYGWHEYGAYTGILPLILFLLSLFYFWRKEAPLIFAGIFAFLVSLGNFAKWAPWNLLHELPFLESTRVPSRFIILFIFSLAILNGLVFDVLCKKSNRSILLKCMLYAVVVFAIVNLLVINGKTFAQAFTKEPEKSQPNEVFQQIIDQNPRRGGGPSSMYLNLFLNVGTLNGYGWVSPPNYPVKEIGNKDYKGEVYLEGNGTASYSYWSPNKLIVDVDALNTTHLVINQNYGAGWRVKGRVVENFNGLLSTVVTHSDTSVEFYYLPTFFVVGMVITLFSIIVVVLFSLNRFKN